MAICKHTTKSSSQKESMKSKGSFTLPIQLLLKEIDIYHVEI
jgi:hypothetical protein